MPTYITLANFTDQGVRTAKETVSRAEAAINKAKKHGVTVKDIYWTQGHYDIVTTIEASDDVAASAFALSVAGMGNVRLQTLRAYSADEMKGVIRKMADVID